MLRSSSRAAALVYSLAVFPAIIPPSVHRFINEYITSPCLLQPKTMAILMVTLSHLKPSPFIKPWKLDLDQTHRSFVPKSLNKMSTHFVNDNLSISPNGSLLSIVPKVRAPVARCG